MPLLAGKERSQNIRSAFITYKFKSSAMQIQIHSSLEVKKSEQDLIHEKVDKLDGVYQRIERADIYLKEGDGILKGGKIAEIRLAVPKNDLFVKAEAENLATAIIDATDKLRRQLIKHKDKLNRR